LLDSIYVFQKLRELAQSLIAIKVPELQKNVGQLPFNIASGEITNVMATNPTAA
jgi:hypothetical protein